MKNFLILKYVLRWYIVLKSYDNYKMRRRDLHLVCLKEKPSAFYEYYLLEKQMTNSEKSAFRFFYCSCAKNVEETRGQTSREAFWLWIKTAKENYKYRKKALGLERIHAKLIYINTNQNITCDYMSRGYVSEIQMWGQLSRSFHGISSGAASEEEGGERGIK